MHVTSPVNLLLFALLITPLSNQARAQPNVADDQAACRQVVERVMLAIEAGDGATLRDLISVDRRSAAQQEGVAAIVECIVAQRALEQAMTQRWGRDPARPTGQTTFLPADRQAVRSARVDVRGDNNALLIVAPNVSPISLRRNRFDGQWRIVLQIVGELNDDADRIAEIGSQRRIGYFRAVARALQQIRQKVVAGAIDSPAAANAAVQKLLTGAAGQHPT